MGDTPIRQNVLDELDFDSSIDAARIGVAGENCIVACAPSRITARSAETIGLGVSARPAPSHSAAS